MTDVTELLARWNAADAAAFGALLPLVYDELRRIAGHCMRRERPDHSLQPTALVRPIYGWRAFATPAGSSAGKYLIWRDPESWPSKENDTPSGSC